jgi:branched-subunit amino acid aminotransferase/4-amino-4-deoxychorismate lyase
MFAPVTLSQLAHADAVFATNAAVGVRAITAIDGIQWSDEHPVVRILRKQYTDIPPEPL